VSVATRSGSSLGRMPGPFWSTVVRIPSRVKPWAISMAIGPPPIITMLLGARSISNTFSLVRNPASLRPSIGGVRGRLPVHRRMNRVSSVRSWPTSSTVLGPAIRAWPAMISMPMALKRSGSSSVAARSCWIDRIRFHTSEVSTSIGSMDGRPYLSATFMVWAALADASSAFDGTQPVHRQSPPTRWRSTTQTRRPRLAANSAAGMPPEPMPRMTRS
jgi:hypothetical protein